MTERKIPKEVPFALPTNIEWIGGIREEKYKEMPILHLNENGKGRTIFYLHGGAYVANPSKHHFYFLTKLIRKNDYKILFPLYPKAPHYDYKTSYDLLSSYYKEAVKNGPLYMMGDSSGGGLALGLCQYFDEIGFPQPEGIIAISPWVDVEMNNPELSAYKNIDPWLSKSFLSPCAKVWANGEDLRHYRISPLFGKVNMLPRVTLFAGTKEMLYPDIKKFYEKLKKAGMESELIIGEGLPHDYPISPISAADRAIDQISRILQK